MLTEKRGCGWIYTRTEVPEGPTHVAYSYTYYCFGVRSSTTSDVGIKIEHLEEEEKISKEGRKNIFFLLSNFKFDDKKLEDNFMALN